MAVFSAGQILTAAQLNGLATWEGWTGYTPTFTQTATITKTVGHAVYSKVGRIVTATFNLSATSAGTAGGTVSVGLPFTSAVAAQAGVGLFLDASTSTRYVLVALTAGDVVTFRADVVSTAPFGSAPAVTVASGDSIQGSITYEATS